MNIAGKIKENRLKWFEHVKRRNNDDIVKKICEIRVDGNRGRGSPKLKWMRVIAKEMKACKIYENMVKDREEWRKIIQVVDPTWVGWRRRSRRRRRRFLT